MMTSDELTEARKKLGLTMVSMAKLLNTPYRTYDKWERGQSRIPGIVEVAVGCLLNNDWSR